MWFQTERQHAGYLAKLLLFQRGLLRRGAPPTKCRFLRADGVNGGTRCASTPWYRPFSTMSSCRISSTTSASAPSPRTSPPPLCQRRPTTTQILMPPLSHGPHTTTTSATTLAYRRKLCELSIKALSLYISVYVDLFHKNYVSFSFLFVS